MKAIKTIADLEQEIERLREALANLLRLIPSYGIGLPEREAQRQAIKAARAALSNNGGRDTT
jgi:hypothetical protein